MLQTKPFGDKSKTKVLVIGHDPRLQKSDSIADYCFFADYYFRQVPILASEKRKYGLAKAIYDYVGWLTSNKLKPDEIMITNLCNRALPHAGNEKTVLIPGDAAIEGFEGIKGIIYESKIEFILAMTPQVNYWLQMLGLYSSTGNFVKNAEPKTKAAKLGYYEPVGKSPFLEICGKKYLAGNIPIYPILHVKQYPLKGRIAANYNKRMEECISSLAGL
jgi:hypothetical protein